MGPESEMILDTGNDVDISMQPVEMISGIPIGGSSLTPCDN